MIRVLSILGVVVVVEQWTCLGEGGRRILGGKVGRLTSPLLPLTPLLNPGGKREGYLKT